MRSPTKPIEQGPSVIATHPQRFSLSLRLHRHRIYQAQRRLVCHLMCFAFARNLASTDISFPFRESIGGAFGSLAFKRMEDVAICQVLSSQLNAEGLRSVSPLI